MEITYNKEEPLLIRIGNAYIYIHERHATQDEEMRARLRLMQCGTMSDDIERQIETLKQQSFTEVVVTDGTLEVARILVP